MLEPSRRRLGGEAVLVLVVLVLVTVAAFGEHVRHGGLYADDWFLAAQNRYPVEPGLLGVIKTMNLDGPASYHMLLPVQLAVLHQLAGEHWHVLIALGLGLGVLAALAFHVALRSLGMRATAAAAAAAIAIAFPWADATRLWPAAQANLLSPLLAWTAVSLAAMSLRAGARGRAVALHAGALACACLAIAAYESAFGIVALSLILYRARGLRWRTAAGLWIADVAVAGVALKVARDSVPATAIDWSALLPRARDLAESSLSVANDALWPFGDAPPAVMLTVAVAVAGLGCWRMGVLRREPAARAPDYRHWLGWTAFGVVLVVAGWVVLIPASGHYLLDSPGIDNRTNIYTVYGYAVTVVGLTGVLGALTSEAVAARRGALVRWAPAIPAAVLLAIGIGYVSRARSDTRAWGEAFAAQSRIMASLRRAAPAVPPGAVIFTHGHPTYRAAGIPIFYWIFDVNGMVKLMYRDKTVQGFPVPQPTTWHCEPEGLWAENPYGYGRYTFGRYGAVVWFDAGDGDALTIDSRRTCESELRDVERKWPRNTYLPVAQR